MCSVNSVPSHSAVFYEYSVCEIVLLCVQKRYTDLYQDTMQREDDLHKCCIIVSLSNY